MAAPIPAPDFRHLSVWPASGARFGDGSLAAPRPPTAQQDMAETRPEASPAA